MDCSPPGSSVHEILQARIPEGVPEPGIKPRSPALHVDSLPPVPPGRPFLGRLDPIHVFSQRSARTQAGPVPRGPVRPSAEDHLPPEPRAGGGPAAARAGEGRPRRPLGLGERRGQRPRAGVGGSSRVQRSSGGGGESAGWAAGWLAAWPQVVCPGGYARLWEAPE